MGPYTHGHKCAETIGTQIGTKSLALAPALFYLYLFTLAPTIAYAFTLHRYEVPRHSALFASHKNGPQNHVGSIQYSLSELQVFLVNVW